MLASPPPQNPILCIKCCEENNEESLIRAKAFCKYPLWGKVIWSCPFVSEKPLKQCTICSCLVGAGRDLFRQSGLHATGRLLTLSATNFPLFPCKPLLRAEVEMSCTLASPEYPAAHPSIPPAPCPCPVPWCLLLSKEDNIPHCSDGVITKSWLQGSQRPSDDAGRCWKCLWAKWGLFHL